MARELTPAQRAAVHHAASRLQILACAGSGKTEVLARRAVALLRNGTPPESIIAFTFTEKAAAELKMRIEARAAEADPRFADLPPVARGMFVGTTHAWALQSLRELGEIYETMDPLTAEQEWVLLLRVARRLGVVDLYAAAEDKPSDKVATAPSLDAFLRSAAVVHEDLVDRDSLRRRQPDFGHVLERYEWLLREMRVMPFRLMITHALDELAPGGRLRSALQGRLRHVFVDEFQDFNRAQDRLVERLVDTGAAVTVVADDDQAIYQWRGGDVKLFVSFPERYAGTERAELAENHRSRPEIVAFAHEALRPIADRLEKPLSAVRPPATDGAVEVLAADTADDEAATIAARIGRLIASGHDPCDIAVLYRSVRTSAGPLVAELRRRGVPVSVVGKTSLLARPEMALVAQIFVYWAGGTWYPGAEYEPDTVTRDALLRGIARVAGGTSRKAARALAAIDALGALLREEGVRDTVEVFNRLLVVLGLPRTDADARWQELGLGRMSELFTEFDHAARRAAPAELYEEPSGAKAEEAAEDATLAADRAGPARRKLGTAPGEVYLRRMKAYLEEFAGRAAEETPDTAPETRNAVQIMTVHQAKGLEFPVVFVPCLVEGRFPSALMGRPQPWYVPDDMFDRPRYEGREEDEARLLYVALTRARELVVLSWFERYPKGGPTKVSRFVTGNLRAALERTLPCGTAVPERAPAARGEEPLDVDFSTLVTYSVCGYRYWLRHVCGFQPKLVPELGFGTLLHHVIAELARAGMTGRAPAEPDVDAVLTRDFYLPFAGPIPAEKLRNAARRRVKAYVKHYGKELVRAVKPEVRFEVPIGGARVRGRMDLMVRAAGGGASDVELIDFKTSANRPPTQVHENQLRLYAAAAERQGWNPVGLYIHDLDTDDVPDDRIAVSHAPAEREAFLGRLEGWVDGIRSARFEPKPGLATCKPCDFRSFCAHAPAAVRGQSLLSPHDR